MLRQIAPNEPLTVSISTKSARTQVYTSRHRFSRRLSLNEFQFWREEVSKYIHISDEINIKHQLLQAQD